MIEAPRFSAAGEPQAAVALPEALFDGTVNQDAMHRAVVTYLSNQRQGTHQTKTRHFVTGGNQKPWRQKGTGRARQGSTRSPLWPGGGTVFGPIPRDYDQQVPKKMKALARRSAFNARARENSVFVIDRFNYEAPHTKVLVSLLQRLGVDGQKVLILTDGAKPNVYLSGRNLPKVEVLPYSDVSTYHLLWSDVVLIEATAIGHTLTPIVEKEHAPVKKKAAAKPAAEEKPKKAAKAKAAAKKTAVKAKAAAPKKSAAKKTKTAAKKSAPKKKGK
jgi:large subunit ribosomal protein L4